MASKFNDWANHIATELEKSKQKLYERENRTIQRSDIKFAQSREVGLHNDRATQVSDTISGEKSSR